MSIFEYNEELHLANLRREGYEEGLHRGKVQDILELLEGVGCVSEELCERVERQKDIEVLSKWLKLAARVGSIQEFEELVSK